MNRSIRITLTALATISLTAAGTTAAFAGERGGNGEPITVNANSDCAYSGLEDQDFNDDGIYDADVVPGMVQNWGVIPKELRGFLASVGVAPSTLCNGSLNPLR